MESDKAPVVDQLRPEQYKVHWAWQLGGLLGRLTLWLLYWALVMAVKLTILLTNVSWWLANFIWAVLILIYIYARKVSNHFIFSYFMVNICLIIMRKKSLHKCLHNIFCYGIKKILICISSWRKWISLEYIDVNCLWWVQIQSDLIYLFIWILSNV